MRVDIDMDIKELEAFVYVVENCSFSRAAELLHLTQPTISSHISALERKLGIKLVVRTTKETYPSDAGKLLYRYAKEILQVRENAAAALKSFSQEMRGTVTLAASTVPSQYYLPHLLQHFHEKYPDIAFNIQMEDSPKVIEMVATRAVEIGFCGTRVEHHKCVAQEFASDCMAIITPNTEKFRAYAGGSLPKELLLSETFISRERSSGTYQSGKEILERLGVDIAHMRTAVEVRSSESVKQMVGEGLGIAPPRVISCSSARSLPFPLRRRRCAASFTSSSIRTAFSRRSRRRFTITPASIRRSIPRRRPNNGRFFLYGNAHGNVRFGIYILPRAV